MSSTWGQFAGLLTAFCWSLTSIFFTLSGRMVGSSIVNRTRLIFALVMVSGLHLITQGALLPLDGGWDRWGWMALSGFLGFVFGDACLFQAFVMLGPRLATLVFALHPVMGTVLAWILLHETLVAPQLIGIALAVSGVIWVVAERSRDAVAPTLAGRQDADLRHYAIGILFALGGALGQSAGFIASKQALVDDYSALSGNLMRLSISTVIIWTLAVYNGAVISGARTLQTHPRALRFILAGSIVGPFIGVWFSLIAVQNAPVGIASTLTSLAPVMLLPLSRLLFKERITRRAVAGTGAAIGGIAVLFLA